MAIGKIPRYYWLKREQTLIPEKDFNNICSLYNSYGDESILPRNNILPYTCQGTKREGIKIGGIQNTYTIGMTLQ